MEADSTTIENNLKDEGLRLPFTTSPGDLLIYREFHRNIEDKCANAQIVSKLQGMGLIPVSIECPTYSSECKMIVKPARVIDRVQWICENCKKKLSIRTGTFFLRIQCSILQTLQMILAWAADADCEAAAENFGVKSRVANSIFDKLDKLAIEEQSKCRLGGENTVVLMEMYPDCMTRLSPDTTDQQHLHRILMIADTKHVPTRYHLHVINGDPKKNSFGSSSEESLVKEIKEVLSHVTEPGSILVTGCNVPPIDGASTLQQLLQHCDADMQHFLRSRIWMSATRLCGAARDVTAASAQRYLRAALHRRNHPELYAHTLNILANTTHKHHTDT